MFKRSAFCTCTLKLPPGLYLFLVPFEASHIFSRNALHTCDSKCELGSRQVWDARGAQFFHKGSAFAFASQVHLQLFLQLQLHCIWLCTCIQGCLHLHCIFMCMYTCICLCICVYACIAFALLLLCIIICARIGQATKASCNGLPNGASQHIGMPDCKSKRVNSFLRHSLIISRNFKKPRQGAS